MNMPEGDATQKCLSGGQLIGLVLGIVGGFGSEELLVFKLAGKQPCMCRGCCPSYTHCMVVP